MQQYQINNADIEVFCIIGEPSSRISGRETALNLCEDKQVASREAKGFIAQGRVERLSDLLLIAVLVGRVDCAIPDAKRGRDGCNLR